MPKAPKRCIDCPALVYPEPTSRGAGVSPRCTDCATRYREAYQANYYADHREYWRARAKANYAQKRGRLKPLPCMKPGCEGVIERRKGKGGKWRYCSAACRRAVHLGKRRRRYAVHAIAQSGAQRKRYWNNHDEINRRRRARYKEKKRHDGHAE